MRDLLAAWQTWVTWAPVLQLSCCPAVLDCVSPALLDKWEQHVQMELSLRQKIHGVTPEKCCSQEKIPPVSVLEQRKICMWSNIPAKDVHASNWWLASFLAALLWQREDSYLIPFPGPKHRPWREEEAHFGNRGTCWQGQECVFWKPCLLMGWEGKGRLDGTETFQKSNRRMQVFKKPRRWTRELTERCSIFLQAGLTSNCNSMPAELAVGLCYAHV